MKHILHVISSPRGAASFSTKLGKAIIEKLCFKFPGCVVTVHDLTQAPFPHLAASHLEAFFTRPENRTPEHLAELGHSETAIDEILAADIIVISVPVYNFHIHSSLKAWIDHVVRSGRTVKFTADGPIGLVQGKKVYLAISSKGVYSDGPLKAFDFVEPYLRYLLAYIGITDVEVLRVEGSSSPQEQKAALEKTMAASGI